MCSTRERTTPRTAAAPHPPPPRARRSTTGRGDPHLKQGGSAGLSPPNPPSFPPGAIPGQSRSSHLRFSLSSSAPAQSQVQLWWETQPPPTHPSVEGMNIGLSPPPFLRLYGITQSSVWGRGTERTVLGRGMREDDSQWNEPTIQGRGQRKACPPCPAPSLQTTVPTLPLPFPAALHAGSVALGGQ